MGRSLSASHPGLVSTGSALPVRPVRQRVLMDISPLGAMEDDLIAAANADAVAGLLAAAACCHTSRCFVLLGSSFACSHLKAWASPECSCRP